MTIDYTVTDTPVGPALIAATPRGVCSVTLGDRSDTLVDALASSHPGDELRRADEQLAGLAEELLAVISGASPRDVSLDITGTPFQRQVWDELRRIPAGETVTYAELARRIGRPRAHRAVAQACAANTVAVFIPCHRVVRTDGGLGGYRWGVRRKQRLLSLERQHGRG